MDSAGHDAHSELVASTPGRILVGLILLIGSIWIVGPNMPASLMRDRVDGVWAPAIDIGLVQDWGVFSPDPRSQSIDLRARVEHADGATEMWDVPEFGPILGAYRQYRWHKWQERVRLDSRQELWDPTAAWIAEQRSRDGELPVRVTLIRRWIDHFPLDEAGAVDSDWNEFEFHVWEGAR